MAMPSTSHPAENETRTDRFGNVLDSLVGYARGLVLKNEVSEAQRQKRANALLRERFQRYGDAGVFNLTGLIRGFPFAEGDDEAMRSYVHFLSRFGGELEALALEKMGGAAGVHDGFLASRVTSGLLATMLAILRPGELVLSLVAADRSHPSVKQAVVIAGGRFAEFTELAALEEALSSGEPPRIVVLTAISPSKNHLPAKIMLAAIAAAHARGALVFIDDAHMAARISLYDEPPGLALGADMAVWSLDKHVPGPRSGFVAGRKELIEPIRARALSLGAEAQLGQYIAGIRAVRSFDPEPIRAAARLSERMLATLAPELDGKGYLAGAGIAVSGEDYLALAMRKAQQNRAAIVPLEAVSYAAMTILEQHGGVLIPAVGMPGSACTFRVMMYPDGARFGEQTLVEAWHTGMNAVAAALNQPDKIAKGLTGGG